MTDTKVDPVQQALADAIQKASTVSGEVYDGVKNVAGKAIDIAQQQAPDLIHQLLLYNFVYSLVLFLSGVVLVIGSIWFTVYSVKKFQRGDWDTDLAPAWISLLVPLFVGVVTMKDNLAWIKIWLAPKIWLIEYVASLIK